MQAAKEGLGAPAIAGIVTACATPTATLNIWPRIEQMLAEGISGNQIGIVTLVTMCAIGMAAIPFAMKKADNWGFWTTCLVFGTFLVGLNYALAVGAIGKAKDHESLSASAIMAQSQRLEQRLQELKIARSTLTFKPTSKEMVDSAREAVEFAKAARDQECGKVGDNCRARVAQLASRQSELAEISGAYAISTKDDQLAAQQRAGEIELVRLGSVPRSSDPQAERIAGVLRAMLGATIATERVADGLISVLAIAAEAFALLMPRILVTAVENRPGTAGGQTPMVLLPANGQANSLGPRGTILGPGRSSLPPAGDPKAFARTLAKAPGRTKAWDIYLAYKSWCEMNMKMPLDFPTFKASFGRDTVEEGGRSYYVGIGVLK